MTDQKKPPAWEDMTHPSDIAVSLDMARRLKEADWPQGKTDYYYVYQRGDWDLYQDCNCDQCWTRSSFRTKCDAPTAEEILRRLPTTIEVPPNDDEHRSFWLTIRHTTVGPNHEKQWHVWYENHDENWIQSESSLANAAAAMWIYLKQYSLIP